MSAHSESKNLGSTATTAQFLCCLHGTQAVLRAAPHWVLTSQDGSKRVRNSETAATTMYRSQDPSQLYTCSGLDEARKFAGKGSSLTFQVRPRRRPTY